MRLLKTWKGIWCFAILSNLGALCYMLYWLDSTCKSPLGSQFFKDDPYAPHQRHQQESRPRETHQRSSDDLRTENDRSWNVSRRSLVSQMENLLTVVIREFEEFDNDVRLSLKSFLEFFPSVSVLIVTDKSTYPPLKLEAIHGHPNIKLFNLNLNPTQSVKWKPENHIRTRYVLLLPDSIRITSADQITKLVSQLTSLEGGERPEVNIIAGRVLGGKPSQSNLLIDLRTWTLTYYPVRKGIQTCDIISGRHLVLLPTSLLLNLSHPWSRPFPEMTFIQTSLRKAKIRLSDVYFEEGVSLFDTPHLRDKKQRLDQERTRLAFNELGIKKVVDEKGKTEWYGCHKESMRCFGTVVDDAPEYLFKRRWTPPCCLEHLRETARHVFRILDKCGVRYWLEGGSLLGAVRNGDIIPWDFDVDLGIYREDLDKCEWLKNAQKQTIVDSQGFVWERAVEGDFLRVQYSQSNHLHVDIFPFYPKDSVMTKDTWFLNHRQDMEFPERFLRPLGTIKFVGVIVFVPNNVEEFVELKFGKGAIHRKEYPNNKRLPFPGNNSLN